jgi:transcriptional regulator with XRE-family HTH domain
VSESVVTPSNIISAKIRGAMGEAMVSQINLGKRVGMGQSVISERLRGQTPWRIDEIVRVAQALEVPLERVLPLDELAGCAS